MAKVVPEKRIRGAVLSILAGQSPKTQLGETLGFMGLLLGCGSWLYMFLDPSPRFYAGLALSMGCAGSLCGMVCVITPWRKAIKASTMLCDIGGGSGNVYQVRWPISKTAAEYIDSSWQDREDAQGTARYYRGYVRAAHTENWSSRTSTNRAGDSGRAE